ncbi:MAG TPA: energy transducer TonB [Bryobacteraceae bacterium]|jgi:hypothetical protein|nr:energy transducer TonB [Bryobacteraceae bacterium]
MFAPQSSSAGRFEGQHPKTKDVVFCDRSAFPLAVPSALVTAIWDQVNEGVGAVPRGGAEVGGLLLGRQSQTGIVLAEEVVPIRIEYRFGPSFRLSDLDINNIRTLMASVQKDPSKAVVGFYRSRTRNDSGSQESDSELLAVLEQAHTSFASNFHYYIAFTPLSKMNMTASVSVRKDDGWDDWQHVTLRSNPMSPSEPIEFEAPPKDPPPPASALEQPSARPAPPLAVPHSEPHPYSYPEPTPPAQPPAHAFAPQERRAVMHSDWMQGASPVAEQPSIWHRERTPWFIGGGVLLATIALGGYLHFSSQPQPRLALGEASVPIPATSAVRTGFSAVREGPLWKLTWDRAAVAALNPTGGVLVIRDGGNKEQQLGLTAADLSSGTFFYTPQTNDLLFSLNIVMPGNQVAEEHVRVLQGPPGTEPLPVAGSAEPVKVVIRDRVRTLRPFTPAPNGTLDSSSSKNAAADIPPPPSLAASAGSPANSTIPIISAPMAGVPVLRENRAVSASAVTPSPLSALSTPAAPAPVTEGPKALRQVSPKVIGPIQSGAGSQVQVRVQIDAEGKVTKVTPITSGAFVDFRLTQAATTAAKSWVFEPARTNGHPVPSEMILDFHFGEK